MQPRPSPFPKIAKGQGIQVLKYWAIAFVLTILLIGSLHFFQITQKPYDFFGTTAIRLDTAPELVGLKTSDSSVTQVSKEKGKAVLVAFAAVSSQETGNDISTSLQEIGDVLAPQDISLIEAIVVRTDSTKRTTPDTAQTGPHQRITILETYGDDPTVEKLASAFRARFHKDQPTPNSSQNQSPQSTPTLSSVVYLIGPDGKLQLEFDALKLHDPASIARDIERVLAHR